MTIDELNALTALTVGDEIPVWDSEESGEPTKKITAQNMTASVKALGSLVNASEMNNALAGKQNTLTFDATPTTGSTNPVTSDGIKTAIAQSTARAMYDANQDLIPLFAMIPEKAGYYNVAYSGSSDADAPITERGNWWWDVLQIGVQSRCVQIAFSCFRNRNIMWFRVRHDNIWYGWYKLTATT